MKNLTRREFAKSTFALAAGGAPTVTAVITGASCVPRGEPEPEAPRRRRIIYNDDGGSLIVNPSSTEIPSPPASAADFLSRRFDWTKNTQVDSYYWCMGEGDLYGQPLPENVGDGAEIMLEATRKAGQEAGLSLRMNDVHDSYTRTLELYPFKRTRRETLLEPTGAVGKYQPDDPLFWFWSAMIYSYPAVREYMLGYIRRLASDYAPDGIEMDYCRAPVCFRFGEEPQGIPIMTQFVADVRQMLDEIGSQVGHRILLMARLPDTPDKSLRFGLDGPTWLKRRLLDALIIGGGYAPFIESWKEYRDLANKYDIPSYPCVNCSVLQELKRVEVLRGMATNWWYSGAEGIYLFNPFVPVDPPQKFIPAEVMYEEWKHIGDAATLMGLDKIFCQDYILDNHLLGDMMTADTPLPTFVDTHPRAITLTVGEDLSHLPAGKQRQLHLRLLVVPAAAGRSLRVELNGQKLAPEKAGAEGWLEHAVQSPPLIQGNNQVRVSTATGELELRRLQLEVNYS